MNCQTWKPILRRLRMFLGETVATFASVFANPTRALTPAQRAKLAEMEADYAELTRRRRNGGL